MDRETSEDVSKEYKILIIMGRYFCEVKGHATGLFDCLFCKYSDVECKKLHNGKPDAFG